MSAKFVHGVPSSTPHRAPPHTATSPKLPPIFAPSPGTPARLRARVTRTGGPRSWGSRHRPAVNQHPPHAPDRAPRTPRGGAARAPTGSRLLGVKEGERQTSLRALLSCVCVCECALGVPRARTPPHPPGDGRERRQQSLGGTRLSRPRSPLEPRRLPPPLPPPPPPGECSGVCPVKPPYQSRPLLQRRRRRRSSAASAAALCFPLLSRRSSAARLGRPDPTSRRYALPPSRPPASPSSPRPPPPSPPRRRRRRHRRRRLLFRAPLVFIESKQASWRRPPSPSHPRTSERPAHRRLANILASHWLILLGATILRLAGGGSSRAVAQARSPFPPRVAEQ